MSKTKPRLQLNLGILLLLHATLCSAQPLGLAPVGSPYSGVPPGAYNGTAGQQLWNASNADIMLRFTGAAFVPFNVTLQLFMIEQAQAAIVNVVGPVSILDFVEALPSDGNSSSTVPFVDMYLRVNAFADPQQLQQWIASGQIDKVRQKQNAIFQTFYAWVFRMATQGVVGTPTLMSIRAWEGVFNVSETALVPLAPVGVVIGLEIANGSQYRNSSLDGVLDLLRDALRGKAAHISWLPSEAGMTADLGGLKAANVTARVMAHACIGRPSGNASAGNWTCLPDVPAALTAALAAANFTELVQSSGYGLTVRGLSSYSIPLKPPQPRDASPSPLPAPGTSPWLPNISYPNAPVPWHLDRLDSRKLEYDGKFTASNLGSGVNVYVLSSGIHATHNEFQTQGGGPSRVRPAWGFSGIDPMKDCNDSTTWYGFGTFAASLIGGLTVGVAKNATLWSARFREQCNYESPLPWQPGGLPSAMDTVISTARRPAVMVIDTWWTPDRSFTDDDEYIYSAISSRLEAAVRANITVIVPAGDTDPCRNVFTASPSTISVAEVDSHDQRAIGTWADTGRNASACVDLWGPGGGLGQPIVAADPTGDASYKEVNTRGAPAFIVAGIAAQYLSLRPDATPAEVKAFLKASATPGAIRDAGQFSPNLLAFTDLRENESPRVRPAAPGPWTADVDGDAQSGTGLGTGAVAGIVAGSLASAGLCGACMGAAVFARRRQKRRKAEIARKGRFWKVRHESGGQAGGRAATGGAGPHDSAGGNGSAYDTNNSLGAMSASSALSGGWEIRKEDIEILKKEDGREYVLGKGSFGTVYKALQNDVQVVAVKKLQLNEEEYERDREMFIREIVTMKYVSRDRNIVQFYGACVQTGHLMLVTEFMEGGDLRVALVRDEARMLDWARRGKGIALDIARGLHFLHVNKVIHLDLKSKNVLLDKFGTAKIGDVGMSKVMAEGYFHGESAIGTFAWAAPELLLGERCTEKVDIYSLGVVLWEIVTREMPIRGALREPLVPEECPQEVVDIIESCMQRDPDARPSARDVYRSLLAAPPATYGDEELGQPRHGLEPEGDLGEGTSSSLHDDSAVTYELRTARTERARKAAVDMSEDHHSGTESSRLRRMVSELRAILGKPATSQRQRTQTDQEAADQDHPENAA